MSFPEATPADLLAAAAGLLRQAGVKAGLFDLAPLSGGANNQVYRVEFADRAPLVLKRYFHSPADRRDRFHSEKSFYDFIVATGQRQPIAQPLAWDREHRLGLFSWIEGRRFAATEITRDAVDQALEFYFALNTRHELPEAAHAPSASEACFDLAQHLECVKRRLSRLATIDATSPLNHAALEFISQRLQPALDKYKAPLAQASAAEKTALEQSRRCLSPSDFGFHNALLPSDGKLVFFDFEYAGWDDPAKFLCDFLCQPAVPVPRSLWPHCVRLFCRAVPGGTNRERITLLLPLYHLKWCAILLNEFLPQEQNRRTFSHKATAAEMETKKQTQLSKAAALLENLETMDLTQALGLDDPASLVP